MKIRVLWVLFAAMFVGASLAQAGITESEFNQIIDRTQTYYDSNYGSMGKPLKIVRDWKSELPEVTPQDKGDHFLLTISGQLARHWVTQPDTFLMILCHETGHFVGGAPVLAGEALSPGNEGLSAEGQSDYWASLKCFRHMVKEEDNIKAVKLIKETTKRQWVKDRILGDGEKLCKKHWDTPAEQALCLRSIHAGFGFARLARIMRPERYYVRVSPPSDYVTKGTYANHPSAQCRMDTYVAAALCKADPDKRVSFSDPNQGVCARAKGDIVGVRPLCWYDPSETPEDWGF